MQTTTRVNAACVRDSTDSTHVSLCFIDIYVWDEQQQKTMLNTELNRKQCQDGSGAKKKPACHGEIKLHASHCLENMFSMHHNLSSLCVE